MNKQELIGHVADRSGLSRNDAARAVETMLEVITSTLKRGDEVRLVGFGNFSVTRRKASTGRNPRTGEPMDIKASSQPKFRPGKVLKDAVQAQLAQIAADAERLGKAQGMQAYCLECASTLRTGPVGTLQGWLAKLIALIG